MPAKKKSRKIKTENKLLAVYIGIGIIIGFLVLLSLAPQVGQRLGFLSQKKQAQESQAAYKIPMGPCYPYGDVNFDRVVNIADVNLVKKDSLRLTFEQKMRADVDADGKVTSTDAEIILKYHSGQLSSFPVCLKTKASPIPTASVRPSPYISPYPTPKSSPATNSYQLKLFPSYYIDLTDNNTSPSTPVSVSKEVYALLYKDGVVLTNQSDFEYSWKAMPTDTNLKITPFAACTNGIQEPCPMDHANIYGFATPPHTVLLSVSVMQKSTGVTVAQNHFYLIVN